MRATSLAPPCLFFWLYILFSNALWSHCAQCVLCPAVISLLQTSKMNLTQNAVCIQSSTSVSCSSGYNVHIYSHARSSLTTWTSWSHKLATKVILIQRNLCNEIAHCNYSEVSEFLTAWPCSNWGAAAAFPNAGHCDKKCYVCDIVFELLNAF